MQELAAKYKMVIVVPIYESTHVKGIYYNTATVIDADGSYLGKYRKTHHQKVDFSIFEGMVVTAAPSHTVSQGRIVYTNGDVRAQKGTGRYIKRPAFTPGFSAREKRTASI